MMARGLWWLASSSRSLGQTWHPTRVKVSAFRLGHMTNRLSGKRCYSSGEIEQSSQKHLDIVLEELNKNKYRFVTPLSRQDEAARYVERILKETDDLDNREQMLQLLKSIQEVEDGKGNEALSKKCIENFQNWVGHSKLGIAYLLHAKANLASEGFVTRVVNHLAKDVEKLMPEELVTLMLMIYFRKQWSQVEFTTILNPVILQDVLAKWIPKGVFSSAEMYVICLALKKVEDFHARDEDFRTALYEFLYDLGRQNGYFSTVDEMAVIQICTFLTRGPAIFQDNTAMITLTLEQYIERAKDELEIETVVKLASYGALLGLKVPRLTEVLISRLERGEELKSTRSLVGIINFLVRTEPESKIFDKLLMQVLKSVSSRMVQKPGELVDVIQALAHLSVVGVYDENITSKIFETVNSVEADVFFNKDHQSLAAHLFHELFKLIFSYSYNELGEKAVLANIEKFVTSESHASKITRPLGFMSVQLQLAETCLDKSINTKFLQRLLRFNQTPIPVESNCPQMPVGNLPFRMRNMVLLKRELTSLVHGEAYCGLNHILPHFPEPDLVFGHLAGTVLTLPDHLRVPNTEPVCIRPPDIGEWCVLALKNNNTSYDSLKKRLLNKLGYRLVIFEPSKQIEKPIRKWNMRSSELLNRPPLADLIEMIIAGKYEENS